MTTSRAANGHVHINRDILDNLQLPTTTAPLFAHILRTSTLQDLAQGPEHISSILESALIEIALQHHVNNSPNPAYWLVWLDDPEASKRIGLYITEAASSGDAYLKLLDVDDDLTSYAHLYLEGPYFADHPAWNGLNPADHLDTKITDPIALYPPDVDAENILNFDPDRPDTNDDTTAS